MKKVTVKFNFSSIIWGIILVAAGVIFALNAFDITDIDIFFKGWWTLFIIIPCTINLFTERDIAGNLFGIALGVFLFLCARDILDYSMIWKLLLPAFVVIIGLKMLIKGIFGRKDWDDEDYYPAYVEYGHGGPGPAPAHPYIRPAYDTRHG